MILIIYIFQVQESAREKYEQAIKSLQVRHNYAKNIALFPVAPTFHQRLAGQNSFYYYSYFLTHLNWSVGFF